MPKLPFGFDIPEESPGFLLWQTTLLWQRLIKKSLDAYSISHAQFVILAVTLWFEKQEQEVTQTLIIQQSKLDKMTVSKALKVLTAEGYVKRSEHPKDTRAKSVQLTKKGKEMAAKLVPMVEKIDKKFFGVLKRAEQSQLNSIFLNLIRYNESLI